MKAVFVSYNQAHTERVQEALDRKHIRGFTKWVETEGRGTETGDPHYGSHAWPAKNSSILAIVPDAKVEEVMEALRAVDDTSPDLGLRAFYWHVEGGL